MRPRLLAVSPTECPGLRRSSTFSEQNGAFLRPWWKASSPIHSGEGSLRVMRPGTLEAGSGSSWCCPKDGRPRQLLRSQLAVPETSKHLCEFDEGFWRKKGKPSLSQRVVVLTLSNFWGGTLRKGSGGENQQRNWSEAKLLGVPLGLARWTL